jgi:hypothetical protein
MVKKYGGKDARKVCQMSIYIPWLTMIIVSFNIWYGLFKAHAYANCTSPFAPFI